MQLFRCLFRAWLNTPSAFGPHALVHIVMGKRNPFNFHNPLNPPFQEAGAVGRMAGPTTQQEWRHERDKENALHTQPDEKYSDSSVDGSQPPDDLSQESSQQSSLELNDDDDDDDDGDDDDLKVSRMMSQRRPEVIVEDSDRDADEDSDDDEHAAAAAAGELDD
jgi:hypothetical protein